MAGALRRTVRRTNGARDPERSRAAILDAATAEFARHGLGGARVDRIAVRAAANKRMLYYYFGDKDALFRAVLEAAYVRIRESEQALKLLDASPEEGVAALVRFTFRYYIEHPEFITLLNSANLHRARHIKGSKRARAQLAADRADRSDPRARNAREGVSQRGGPGATVYQHCGARLLLPGQRPHAVGDLRAQSGRETRAGSPRRAYGGRGARLSAAVTYASSDALR